MADPYSEGFTLQSYNYNTEVNHGTNPRQNATRRQSKEPHGTRKHSTYKGIRFKSGKWVSEIREPKKSTRIWLGTFETPEMAAAAYDVAALALKGKDAAINFPLRRDTYPVPASSSSVDIRNAAALASRGENCEPSSSDCLSFVGWDQNKEHAEYIDEDMLFNMPNLLVDMANGMMLTPPRIPSPQYDGYQSYTGDDLWGHF